MYSGGVSVSSSTKLAYQSKQGKQHKSASVAASTPTVGGGVDRLPNSKSDQTNLTASTTAAGYNNVQNALFSCFCQPRSFDRIHKVRETPGSVKPLGHRAKEEVVVIDGAGFEIRT